jgi:hypothetical protein
MAERNITSRDIGELCDTIHGACVIVSDLFTVKDYNSRDLLLLVHEAVYHARALAHYLWQLQHTADVAQRDLDRFCDKCEAELACRATTNTDASVAASHCDAGRASASAATGQP